jgi:hypothetical protein
MDVSVTDCHASMPLTLSKVSCMIVSKPSSFFTMSSNDAAI